MNKQYASMPKEHPEEDENEENLVRQSQAGHNNKFNNLHKNFKPLVNNYYKYLMMNFNR